MADDDKPKKKGADALYDNDRSAGSEKVTERERVTEREAPAADKGGEGEKKPAGGGEGKASEAKPKAGDAVATAFREMTGRHEGERRDHHNNFREGTRQMLKRHEKELSDYFERLDDKGNEVAASDPADGAKSP